MCWLGTLVAIRREDIDIRGHTFEIAQCPVMVQFSVELTLLTLVIITGDRHSKISHLTWIYIETRAWTCPIGWNPQVQHPSFSNQLFKAKILKIIEIVGKHKLLNLTNKSLTTLEPFSKNNQGHRMTSRILYRLNITMQLNIHGVKACLKTMQVSFIWWLIYAM